MDKQFTKATITEKAADGSFTAVASSATKDRHGESVDIKGWDLKNFKKNPVLLWAHDHTIPAIGVAKRVWISDGKLMFKGVWQEVTDMGKAAKQLVEEGIINSFSVGFLPSEMEGNTYTKQELLEISLVNVPANPDAMMLAYKSLKGSGFEDKVLEDIGIDTLVVDKLVSMEKDIKELKDQVKVTPTAPQTHSQVIRTRQSVVKAVAKASDQLLAGEKDGIAKDERVKLAKIIKRGAEILSKSHKEQING